MSAPRKIYTSSEVMIQWKGDLQTAQTASALRGTPGAPVNGVHETTFTAAGDMMLVPTVTSATFTIDTPRENVTVFGRSGQVDTVQNESTTATIEIVYHPWGTLSSPSDDIPPETASHFHAEDLDALMLDAEQDSPQYAHIWVHGVGALDNALLSSITAEGSVGALPTITLSFDGKPGLYRHYDATNSLMEDEAGGVGGGNPSDGFDGDGATKYTGTSSMDIANMVNVGVRTASGTFASSSTKWVQSATFSWEMPVERINKLGQSPDDAESFGSPPGTSSIAVEGIERTDAIIQASFGSFTFRIPASSQISNVTNNLAVGEVGATYNTTTEGTAAGCTCCEVPA